jgi:hypothetical protein
MDSEKPWKRLNGSTCLIATILILTSILFLQSVAYVSAQNSGDYIVTEFDANILSEVTSGGARTVIYAFPAGTFPIGVAIDSAGNYIVITWTTGLLYRITTGGFGTVVYTFAVMASQTGLPSILLATI